MSQSQEFFELENQKLKDENQILIDKIKNLKLQIHVLEKANYYKDITISSLRETVVSSQVYKIPHYQKTIALLNERVCKIQEENNCFKKMVFLVKNETNNS